jgi:PAS domain S-box-containing protein
MRNSLENQLEHILDRMTDAFFALDSDWNFTIVHPDYYEAVKRRMHKVEQGETVDLVDHKLVRLDGEIVDIETKSLPTIHEGEPAIYSIAKDVTEKKKHKN